MLSYLLVTKDLKNVRIDCKQTKKTDSHEDIQMDTKTKNSILSLVNAGPPDRVSVLFIKYGGHKIRQMIVILKIIYAKANSPFC